MGHGIRANIGPEWRKLARQHDAPMHVVQRESAPALFRSRRANRMKVLMPAPASGWLSDA